MTDCRLSSEGYKLNGEHYDGCDKPSCEGCFPCVPRTEHGDPMTHCTARSRCSEHVAEGTQTCPRCIGKTRKHIGRIVELASLLHVLAVETRRIDSEAANLAGPAVDPAAWADRKVQAIREGTIDQLPDDDPDHPYAVLGRWQMMLESDPRECYPVDRDPISINGAAKYLANVLSRDAGVSFAQDDEQDFPLFVRETATCLAHLEAVFAVAKRREVGAPCPACIDDGAEKAPRLVMERGTREELDRWVCPTNRMHAWSDADYRLRVDAGYATVASALTASQFAEHYQIKEGSVRGWAAKIAEDGKPLVRKRGKDHRGLMLYDKADVMDVRAGKRKAKGDTADTMPESA